MLNSWGALGRVPGPLSLSSWRDTLSSGGSAPHGLAPAPPRGLCPQGREFAGRRVTLSLPCCLGHDIKAPRQPELPPVGPVLWGGISLEFSGILNRIPHFVERGGWRDGAVGGDVGGGDARARSAREGPPALEGDRMSGAEGVPLGYAKCLAQWQCGGLGASISGLMCMCDRACVRDCACVCMCA